MNKEALRELRARVEKCSGPDREIDGALAAAFEPGVYDVWPHLTPEFTASIDAALALVERCLPGQTWSILNCAMRRVSENHSRLVKGISAQEICLAAIGCLLSALEAQAE